MKPGFSETSLEKSNSVKSAEPYFNLWPLKCWKIYIGKQRPQNENFDLNLASRSSKVRKCNKEHHENSSFELIRVNTCISSFGLIGLEALSSGLPIAEWVTLKSLAQANYHDHTSAPFVTSINKWSIHLQVLHLWHISWLITRRPTLMQIMK